MSLSRQRILWFSLISREVFSTLLCLVNDAFFKEFSKLYDVEIFLIKRCRFLLNVDLLQFKSGEFTLEYQKTGLSWIAECP